MASIFPLPIYNFKVSFSNVSGDIGFQEVQGLGADIEYEEIKDIANSSHTNRTFKRIQYKNLILKKGVFKEGMDQIKDIANIFYDNSNALRNVEIEPVTIIIELLNEKNEKVISWTLQNCVPVKYEFGALNAMESKVLIETMEFQYHSMKTE